MHSHFVHVVPVLPQVVPHEVAGVIVVAQVLQQTGRVLPPHVGVVQDVVQESAVKQNRKVAIEQLESRKRSETEETFQERN